MKTIKVFGHQEGDEFRMAMVNADDGEGISDDSWNTITQVLARRKIASHIDQMADDNKVFNYMLPITL